MWYAWGMTWDPAVVDAVAYAFAGNLKVLLTPQELEQVVKRNKRNAKKAGYENCCASHDFCDANMPMAEAFEEVLGREIDMNSNNDTAIWNKAWELAKAVQFEFAAGPEAS